jgi:hypothetical protein
MLIALAAIVAAHSNITYLECDTVQMGQSLHYSITLNEDAGTADWSNSIVRRRDAAQFSASAVHYFDTTISRENLRMVRRNTDLLGNGFTEAGQCHVMKPEHQAF